MVLAMWPGPCTRGRPRSRGAAKTKATRPSRRKSFCGSMVLVMRQAPPLPPQFSARSLTRNLTLHGKQHITVFGAPHAALQQKVQEAPTWKQIVATLKLQITPYSEA